MNKQKIFFLRVILFFIVVTLFAFTFKSTFANEDLNEEVKYTESYKKWLELSEEERKNCIMPRKYEVSYTKAENKNPLLKAKMLKTGLNSKFSLKDLIPNNLIIKNQQNTGSCWTFAAISSLETNLAIKDYYNQSSEKIYDFSERHMEYSTSRVFKNNEINSMGYNRTVGSGGSWDLASSYLTNGSGAIDESQMPFENNENLIELNQIKNKDISSQVYDTIEFPDYNSILVREDEVEQIKGEIKNHIYNNGSVMASIVAGGSFFNISKISNTTGAVRVSAGAPGDHGTSIIGWDDNYNISNWNEFEEQYRPKANGAWIARNSWGTESGKNGIIYISYEDKTVTQSMAGVVKSKNNIEYSNIYQHDYYYPNSQLVGGKKLMLCNEFDKKTSGKEYITNVSLHIPDTYICRVFINPNGTNKTKNELKLVQLKAGGNITLKPGYHTLELAEPVEIKSNKFLVAIEISSTDDSSVKMSFVKKDSNLYQPVEVKNGNCYKLDNYEYRSEDDWSNWKDLSEEGEISTIKAFTLPELYDDSLKNIEIATPPTKTDYFEGENFDKTGMVVKAYFNSATRPEEILDSSDYNVERGTNLEAGQTSVTITYGDKSANQTISVEENSITEIIIKNPPTKTEYKEGQNFDKNGMVVEAYFKNGTKREITDYSIDDGNNLKENQNEVTISYNGKTVKQAVTVTPNPLMKINVTKQPNKTKYVVGQNFDKNGMVVTGTFQDQTTQEILDYTIEDGTNLQKEQTKVTIKYNGKTTEQSIEVEEKTITGISINKKPDKLQYLQNKEELDVSGGSIKVNYNDNSSEIIEMDSEQINITGFNNEKIGANRITITYGNNTITFDVEIVAEELPLNSDFSNANCNVNSIKYYTASDSTKKDYFIIDVTISNLLRNNKNDSYEYYYYLSQNKDESNINNWIKISEEQNSNDKLKFEINSNDIKNYSEISDSSNLYLYIKEVALKGSNQHVKVTLPMKIEVNGNEDVYIDNAKVENSNSKYETEDKTVAQGKLPNTGIVTIISIIVIITLIGTFGFIKYKNLSKYIK